MQSEAFAVKVAFACSANLARINEAKKEEKEEKKKRGVITVIRDLQGSSLMSCATATPPTTTFSCMSAAEMRASAI